MHQHIQVPPDSTGKRVVHSAEVRIAYKNLAHPFVVGDQVLGQTSGILGAVSYVLPTDTTTGFIDIVIADESVGTASLVDEALTVYGVTHAVANSVGVATFATRNVITSGDNFHHTASVTPNGALKVAQEGGDAFGRIQMSEASRLAEYVFSHTNADDFESVVFGGGAFEHHPEYSGMVLRVDGANGSKAQMTSHLYHRYQAGLSQNIIMTAASGDAGKAGLVRRWGYYDDQDGVFFELNGTTLYAVVRSTTSGSMVETKIPQSEWNSNRINGETGFFNIGGYDIDVTKDNIWWMDIQWLGAGTVRFGIFHDGERIVCHEEHHDGRLPVSYMRTGSLPLRYEILNTSATASTSELTVFCATVQCEGKFTPETLPFAHTHATPDVLTTTAPVTISSMRMKQTLNSQDNRATALPQNMSVYTSGGAVVVEVVKNGTLGDAGAGTPWSEDAVGSGVEFDHVYKSCTGGRTLISRVVPAGLAINIDLSKQFNLGSERVKRHATIAEYDTYSFRVTPLAAGTTNVLFTLEWVEIRR